MAVLGENVSELALLSRKRQPGVPGVMEFCSQAPRLWSPEDLGRAPATTYIN